jgi:hypothetical protein
VPIASSFVIPAGLAKSTAGGTHCTDLKQCSVVERNNMRQRSAATAPAPPTYCPDAVSTPCFVTWPIGLIINGTYKSAAEALFDLAFSGQLGESVRAARK